MHKLTNFKLWLPLLAVVALLVGGTANLGAQSLVSGDLVGTVTDPTGAAVPGASITVIGQQDGSKSTLKTNSAGAFRVPLLKPETYKVSVTAPGFGTKTTTVVVPLGQTVNVNTQLAVGNTSSVVEVNAASADLLQTVGADISTTINTSQLQNVPNPGGDITYPAQTAPGVIMNTSGTGGYGNFSAFGLPGTSNNFTVNGASENDPFLNLNDSGPTNLTLGLNDISEVDVVSNAYTASEGSFAGLQVNAITRSGGNKFHGNLHYYWNGRLMNANDYFFNNEGEKRAFTNNNQPSGAISGPIWKDKLFFFGNYEYLTFVTPGGTTQLNFPTASYISSVVGTNGLCSDATSSLHVAGNSDACAYYKNIFNIYKGSPFFASATPVSGSTTQLTYSGAAKTRLTERTTTERLDYTINSKDSLFAHFKYDEGIQPTYSDPINSAFDAQSVQPDYEGQLSERHIFSDKAVNSLIATGTYYSAIFKMSSQSAASSALLGAPISVVFLDNQLSNLNVLNYAFPQGRNVTQWQIADDFSYSLSKHTVKAGFNYKRDDLSDYDLNTYAVPLLFATNSGFKTGVANDGGSISFASAKSEPLALYTLGIYAQDDWKPTPKLGISAGIRVEHNSNPVCQKNCLSNFGQTFSSFLASGNSGVSTAYNKQIETGLHTAFTKYQAYEIEPRIGFTYQPFGPKTVIRAGFGIFTDIFPGTIADDELSNFPLTTGFSFGSPALYPGDAKSSQTVGAAAYAAVKTGFPLGASYNNIVNGTGPITTAVPAFSGPNAYTVTSSLKYPTYDEWSLQVEHSLTQADAIHIEYVGNNGYHEPVQNPGVNGSGSPLPASTPAPTFGVVTQVQSNGSSNYNGLAVSYLHKGKRVNAQINYTWSHNLDEISNGGILAFNYGSSIENQINPNNIRQNYGNSDYDVRHSINGNYLWTIPGYGSHALRYATEGWQVGGTVFFRTGLPFTPDTPASFSNYGTEQLYLPLAPLPGTRHHCGAEYSYIPQHTAACFTAANFSASSPAFGANDRNQFTGPDYFNTDLSLSKSFKLPAGVNFEVGVNAYNLFNHPNFENPVADVTSGFFGYSTSAVSAPTSAYGAGYGDTTVRMLQITGKLNF